MKIVVECTVEVEVELADDVGNPHFLIEENSCPGTGRVGSVIYAAIKHGEVNGVCWACNLKGRNKIRSINGRAAAEEPLA